MSNPYPTSSFWPADFGGCTLHGTYVGLDGQVVAGTITLAASPEVLYDFTTPKVILPRALSVTLDVNGSFSILVPATNDPDISPIDWTYTITENFIGGRTYAIEAPLGGNIDITAAGGVPDANGTPIVRGPRGLDGAVLTVQGLGIDEAANVDLTPVVVLRANNLADVASAPTARGNLGLGTAAVRPESYFGLATTVAANGASIAANTAAIAALAPPGSIIATAAVAAPAGWLLCNGAAVSRVTYAALLAAICHSTPANTYDTSRFIDGISSTTGWQIGWFVSGPGIPPGSTISAIISGTSIQITNYVVGSNAITLLATPFGVGDGSTTFNLPDLRGRVLVGVDATQTEFASLNTSGGEKTHVLSAAELPAHTHAVQTGSLGAVNSAGWRASTYENSGAGVIGGSFESGVVTGSYGFAHNNLQPYLALNYLVKT